MWLSEPPVILLLVAHGCQGLKYISRNPQILNACCGFTIKNLWSAIAVSSNECQTACLATDQYVLLQQEHEKNSWIRVGRLWCSSHREDPRHKHRMYICAALLGSGISQIVPTFPLLSEKGFHNKPDWFGPSSALSYFPNEFPLFHCCFPPSISSNLEEQNTIQTRVWSEIYDRDANLFAVYYFKDKMVDLWH